MWSHPIFSPHHQHRHIERQFGKKAHRPAAVARVAPKPPPDDEEQERNSEDGRKDSEPPVSVGQKQQRQRGQQALKAQAEGGDQTEGPVNGFVLRLILPTSVWHQSYYLRSEHLGQRVAGQDGKHGRQGSKMAEHSPKEQKIADESQHAIRADVGILHDGKSALAVSASAEPVEEISQPILMQRTGQKEPHNDGQDYSY